MMSVKKIGIVPIAFVLIAGAAIAQEMRGARPANPGFTEQPALCRVDEHVDGQLGYIKAELKITEAQTAQWNVFADAFRADKEKQAQTCKTVQEQMRSMASAPLPDSMKIMADRLSARLESIRAMYAAIGPLYGSLSQEQKKKADEIMKGVPGM
jgi:Spy/CpxP family protein refolding chaperone